MHSAFTDSENLIRMLDAADSIAGAADLRVRSYELLSLKPGTTVVDVGCGAGRAVAELAARGARAVGVDLDPVMVRAARERFPAIDVRDGDALSLPLAGGEAQGYRADKVYHVLPSPAGAVAEARRVLATGGRIVLVGQDWDTMVIDSSLPYRNLLLDAGFEDVTLEVHTAVFTDASAEKLLPSHAAAARAAGVISEAEAAEWLSDQAGRAAAGRLLIAVPMFLAAGTRAP